MHRVLLFYVAGDYSALTNNAFHKGLYGIPKETHLHACGEHLSRVSDTVEVRKYLCPARKENAGLIALQKK